VLAESVIPLTGWSKSLAVAAARALGFDKWYFPCVRLAPRNVYAYTDNHVQDVDWVVWGLTFNTIRRLLKHANGHREYLALDTPYHTNNAIFNAFVAYFYKYYTHRHSRCLKSPNPDTDPNLHRKILLSSFGGLAGVYGLSAAVGVGIYSLSTALITSAIS
jgi:hypothetical protein